MQLLGIEVSQLYLKLQEEISEIPNHEEFT